MDLLAIIYLKLYLYFITFMEFLLFIEQCKGGYISFQLLSLLDFS